jgi:hypothetical protein
LDILAGEERIRMKLNIINLLDNFKKFSEIAINHYPTFSQELEQLDCSGCIRFLKDTQNYLILEQKPTGAIKLFNILLEKRRKGIIITRNHPDIISTNILSNKIDMYWLSTEDFDYVIHPWDTRLLIDTVENFVDQDNQGVILLNGLEYLSTYNESNILLDIINYMGDLVTNTDAKFLITLDPIALGNQFISYIEKNSELIILPSNPFKEVLT